MKKQLNLPATLMLCIAHMFYVAAMPNPEMIVRIQKAESAKTITVQLANLQKQRTEVAIQDMAGKLWFSEYVWKEDAYAKNLNLNEMPNGQYICFVKNSGGLHTQTFWLDNAGVVFYESIEPGSSKTGLSVNTGSPRPSIVRIAAEGARAIRIQLTNLQKQDARIQLNALGEGVTFEQKVSGEQGYAKNINVEGMNTGYYFLYVNINEASLVQFIQISSTGMQLGKLEHHDNATIKIAGVTKK